MKTIKIRMEELRKQLNELVDSLDNCNEENVLEVSRELDKVICEYVEGENAR